METETNTIIKKKNEKTREKSAQGFKNKNARIFIRVAIRVFRTHSGQETQEKERTISIMDKYYSSFLRMN